MHTETSAGHAGVVGDNGQVLDVGTVADSVNQGVRDTGKAESTDQHGGRALHVLDGLVGGGASLVNSSLGCGNREVPRHLATEHRHHRNRSRHGRALNDYGTF
jgi:hypothetical protein